jgi:hypothetical protein
MSALGATNNYAKDVRPSDRAVYGLRLLAS